LKKKRWFEIIIIDFSGISVANICVQHSHDELSEELLRHMILNTLSFYNRKFKQTHGHTFIACDHGSWRRAVYEHYKASRKTNREASPIDWVKVYGWLDQIKDELQQFSPFTVLDVPNTEADDIIATLVIATQEFGQCEDVMIVSADKDFLQLQRYSNVKQFSNLMKKLLIEKNPRKYLFEHIVRGDAGDGVPNIFSDDDTFIVEGKRQHPVSAKKLEALWESASAGEVKFEKEVHRRNYDRNEKLIDLHKIPADITKMITDEIAAKDKRGKTCNRNAFLNYLIKKRCNQMIERLPEFF